jgi:Ca2+-binding RTX toxin-like protein
MPSPYTLDDNDNIVTYTDAGNISVDALGGNDTIVASNTGNAVLKGGDGLDSLTGGNGADTLNGGSGDDILVGGNGNDILDGSSGADELTGGNGDDTYIINDGNDTINENFGEGTDTVKTGLSGYTLDNNVENLIGAALTSQALTGNALNNTITGGAGDDTIDGLTGDDTMTGGLGDDTYTVDSLNDVVIENVNSGNDTIRTSLVTYVMGSSNIENLRTTGAAVSRSFTGNAFNNAITGGTLADILDGGAGNDTLNGGTGADTMTGGLGDDTFTVDNAGDIVNENSGEGTDTVRSNLTTYTLGAAVENVIGTRGGGGQTLTGNALDNSFSDNGTANTFVGGAGDDAYTIDASGDVVTENASEGTDVVKTTLANYTLAANVENLMGVLAGGGQTLTGNALDNLISDGGEANAMRGGIGNDTFIVETVGDTVTENLNEGIDSVRSTIASFTLSANIENLQGEATTSQILTGNALANVIVGGVAADTLDGAAGDDSLKGGLGNDIYIIDSLNDGIIENAAEGTDTIKTAIVSFGLVSNVENLVGTAVGGGQTLTGNALNNVISDNGAVNTMLGGLGNDTYVIDNGGDIATENLNEGTDTVQTAIFTYTLGANIENLNGTLSIGGQTLIGNALANTFSDTNLVASNMQGGLGNDIYVLDNQSDAITENASEGTDTVRSSINGYVLASNLENLLLLGTTASGAGNALANILTGNAAANTLSGSDGNDTLVGGAARDTLAGGLGKDIFDFNTLTESGKTTTSRDVITDFLHLNDRMDLKTLDASTKVAGDQAFKLIGTAAFHKLAGELHYTQSNLTGTVNDKTIVEGDTNGDGKADFQIELTGLKTLTVADFIL